MLGTLCLPSSVFSDSGAAGYYPLTAGFGFHKRTDMFANHYDGIPRGESTTIELDDATTLDDVEEGHLVITRSGEVTGHWVQEWHINATWSAMYRGAPYYWGMASPKVRLTIDVTGTVSGVTEESVTLDLEAHLDCHYVKTGTFRGGDIHGSERFGPDAVEWTVENLPVSFQVTAKRLPEGGLEFEVPTITKFLPALADASPQSDESIEIRNLAWPETRRTMISHLKNEPEIPGLVWEQEVGEIHIGAWTAGPTRIAFGAPLSGLRPVHPEYHLRDVPASYGYIASGNWEEFPGNYQVAFRYGSEELVVPLAFGQAKAPFNYGLEPTVIEADILDGGELVETLSRPLHKIEVPPWASPATDWTARAGVEYSRTLNWPVSLATTRTLQNASAFSGLWGITGAAESEMSVHAHSLGTPTEGTLEGRVNFQAAGRQIGFTLGGRHETTLDASGLSLEGKAETSQLNVQLLNTNVTALSLIPGLQAAVVSIHPALERMIRGTGLGLRSELNLSAAGEYAAGPFDSRPHFTSGSILGAVDVSARLNVLPQMLRDFIYLGVEGGGGLQAEIQLAPTVEMTSLGGRLYFTGIASILGFDAITQHEMIFGDYSPPAGTFSTTGFAALSEVPIDFSAANMFPPRSHVTLLAGDFGRYFAVSSIPDPEHPAPASTITLRTSYNGSDWARLDLPGQGRANLAPTIGTARLPTPNGGSTSERQAVVWSRSTTPLPESLDDVETFANGMELYFQEYNASRDQWERQTQELTSNGLCDFGPVIPQGEAPFPARVFWARSHGTDFTGSTTPLTLHTRRWLYRQSSDPDVGWSPEVQAVGGLSDIVDWKPLVIDAENSVLVITRDQDGDFETIDDSELWLVREIAGVWSEPVRLTENDVPDEHPVMFLEEGVVRLAWRQSEQIVYLEDLFAGGDPQVLLPASVEVGPGFAHAQLGRQTLEEGEGLFLVWPEDNAIALAYAEMENEPAPGGLLPPPMRYPVGEDTVIGFTARLTPRWSVAFMEGLALTMPVSPGSAENVPAATHSRLDAWSTPVEPMVTSQIGYFLPNLNQTVHSGERIKFDLHVREAPGARFQWYRDGERIPGATSAIFRKDAASLDDVGTYTLRIIDLGGVQEHYAGTVAVTEPYGQWALKNGLTPPFDDPDADPDGDGAPNKLEYLFGTAPNNSRDRPITRLLPSAVGVSGNIYDAFTFDVNASATGYEYVVEISRDLRTWQNADDLSEYYGSVRPVSTVSPDGRRRNIWVIVPSENDPPGWPPEDWSNKFVRVRLLEPSSQPAGD